MIQEAINAALDAITSRFWGAVDFATDPFWGWLFLGLIVIAAIVAATYFFGSWFTVLRPIGGVIVIVVTAMLYAFRRGEKDQEARDAKHRRPPPDPPRQRSW